MNKQRNSGIALRIGTIITIISVISMSIMIVLIALTASEFVTQDSADHLSDIVSARTVMLKEYVKTSESDLVAYASNPLVAEVLKRPDNVENYQKLQAYSESFVKTNPLYEGIYVADLETKCLAHSNPKVRGQQFRTDPNAINQLISAFAPNGKVVNFGIIVSPASGQIIMSMYYPLYEDGTLLGYVGCGLYTEETIDGIGGIQISGLDDSDFAIVSLKDMSFVYNKDKSLSNTVTEEQGYLDIADMVNSGTTAGKHTFVNADGEKVMAFYEYIPEMNWVVVLNDSEKEINADLTQLFVRTLIIGIVICVIIIVSVVFVLIPVGKDLKAVEKTIRRLSRIELDAAENISYMTSRNDECGLIAQALHEECSVIRSTAGDINRVLSEMADGNLAVDVNAHSEYYIGDFAFLSDVLRKINSNLISVMSNISTAANQVRYGSEQVSTGAQSLSKGTIEQTSSIEGLADNLQSIEQTVRDNTNECSNANDLMAKTFDQVSVATDRMNYLTGAMNNINDSFEKINGIIKTIEDIAFQTNILALNAAVEASRAGEAGKGFAVVADEVRNLAAKSAEAVKDTSALIEQSGEAVVEGSRITQQTAEAITSLDSYTRSLKDIVNTISDSGIKQLSMVESISGEITRITNVVQTTSATAEESAAASEELTGQAASLNEMIGKFRI